MSLIAFDPANYRWENKKQLQEFYQQFVANLNIPSKGISIVPFSSNGDFALTSTAGTTDAFFDIGNQAFGNISNVAAYPGKSFYHGSLQITTHLTAAGGGTNTYSAWLATGPNASLSNYLYKQKAPFVPGDVIFDVNVDANTRAFVDIFDSVFFNFLHLQVGSTIGTSGLNQDFLFNGLRIDY